MRLLCAIGTLDNMGIEIISIDSVRKRKGKGGKKQGQILVGNMSGGRRARDIESCNPDIFRHLSRIAVIFTDWVHFCP